MVLCKSISRSLQFILPNVVMDPGIFTSAVSNLEIAGNRNWVSGFLWHVLIMITKRRGYLCSRGNL